MARRSLVQVAAFLWSYGIIALALSSLPAPAHVRIEEPPQGGTHISNTCAPPASDAVPASGTHLNPGAYQLTMVATEGPRTGTTTSGLLTLRPTSHSDRSPVTGHTPAHYIPRDEPFIGSVTLDFAIVGAPIGTGDTLIPSPTSSDPVRPGVLVLVQSWQSRSLPKQPILLIGTLANRRDEAGWLDGPGIGLWVRAINPQGFAGTWGEWGIVSGGRGTFCAQAI
jgi:hypothetical protein